MNTYSITSPDYRLKEQIQQRIDNLNKPLGALGRLEEIASQICLAQQTCHPALQHPCHVLFAADHGIEHEGVSASPREITWQQMINFTQGGGGVNMFCRQHGFELLLVDVGVDYNLSGYPQIISRKIAWGTRNFLYEAAMSEEEMERALQVGTEMTDRCRKNGCNIICFGEMGIGNTSPSAVWLHLLGNHPLEECIGCGSGLNSEGVSHKYKVLSTAVNRFRQTHPTPTTEEIIRYFGGFEMVAAVGAMLRAAELGMIILVDGFIMSACMLAASRLYPATRAYALFGHEGEERGHRLLLADLHARGLLQLGFRLGEGTGALCAYPIIESAVRMMNEMNTFDQSHITKYF
ncbi:MAG: nicotinate-nucleotide--dimethylbenzimidazole phosphoribosyltransferase [Candidatus Paraprevotella stercoravium]|uniref:Nicotinate-nucleotide--dimethylbenzimidazole phosphoribosyltransferase n=2 Tax=Bacteroidales TaxID=171549 RepID=A0ABT7U5L9_9BACE|nr:nicotinate-nucleotide--dimethylbenzimidazole phosphoribosyltransferase [Candidatus Paraprevotella stercoravium]MDM8145817.1 nicotinate-nucleotide--dimethylbenzimidazole phosphoribosyltransferase [Bacteroides eggerthii]